MHQLCTHSKNRIMCTQISFVTMLHSVLTMAQEILFLAMIAYAHIIFYSTDTYCLPLILSLCICIVMLVTWHADHKPFLIRFTCPYIFQPNFPKFLLVLFNINFTNEDEKRILMYVCHITLRAFDLFPNDMIK